MTKSANVVRMSHERGGDVFDERLAGLRVKKGITQKKCAADLGVDYSKYNKWERGVFRPDYEMLSKMADYFECTIDYLLGRDNVPKRDHADIAARTGLSDGAIAALEEMHSASLQRYAPVVRAVNDLLEQRTDMEKHLLNLISMYLYYDLSGDTPFRTTNGDPVHTVDLTYHNSKKGAAVITSVLKMNAHDIVSSKILDALRDLSSKIKEDASK